MNLHEYQAKQLFEHYGLPVKNGAVCQSVDEVDLVLAQLSGDKWAAKCQVHAGGRGKAGGVKLVHDVEEARSFAEKWLGQRLVTFQTDKLGQPVNGFILKKLAILIKNFT